MADLLNVGTRALNAFQTAISTTGNNIVNANTEGYSRQRVNLESEKGAFNGGFYIGNGVGIDSIQRSYDEILRTEVLNRTASHSSLQTLHSMSSQLETLFAEPDFGAQAALDQFKSAMSSLANNPSSIPERQVLLTESNNLVDRLTSLGDSLNALDNQVRQQITADLEAINESSDHLVEINKAIDSSPASSGAPNALLDKRDVILRELAEKIDINVVNQNNGVTAVYLSNGTALVNGLESIQLQASPDQFSTGIQINQMGLTGGIDSSALLSGGSLAGVLKFQQNVLSPTLQEFGLVSLAVASATNQQQSLGLDLNGAQGADIFSLPAINALPSFNNIGNATVSVDLDDYSQLDSSDYELGFDGANWTLTNLNTGNNVSATDPLAAPLALDGLDISVTGSAGAGDRFVIQPSKAAVGNIGLTLNKPEGIAAATALRSSSSLSNGGNASITNMQITDPDTLPLATNLQLLFDPDALGAGIPGFTLTGIAGGPLAFDPATDSAGRTYSLAGFNFSVSGSPAAGDTLNIENNFGSTGDNSNVFQMVDLLDSKLLTNIDRSLLDINSSLLGFMGSIISGVESSLSIENTLLNSADQSLESISGVNLDEEAADLLRFQQAYQASAQIITVAEELFNTLLNATR